MLFVSWGIGFPIPLPGSVRHLNDDVGTVILDGPDPSDPIYRRGKAGGWTQKFNRLLFPPGLHFFLRDGIIN